MTKHTPTNVPVFTDKMPVAKRKGNRFRRFDPETARMSPWFSDAPKVSTDNGFTPRQVQAVKRVKSAHTAETLARMTKAELQELAGNATPPVPFNTKTTKAALIEALTA